MPNQKRRIMRELVLYLVLSLAVFVLAGVFDLFERLVSVVHMLEDYEADEIIVTVPFVLLFMAIFAYRRWRENVLLRRGLESANNKLMEALAEIKELEGIIPICAECKKIRDDEGYWQQLEEYISSHSGASFSHGLCPECFEKAMRELKDQETEEALSSV